MQCILKNAKVYKDGAFIQIPSYEIAPAADKCVVNASGLFVFPGFLDVHVHLREPGFFYKETIKTGTMAAAHGGYTDVCSMPNLNPVPDDLKNLNVQREIIKRDAVIGVHPYASITAEQKGEKLAKFDELADAVAFSDDGRGVQDEETMLLAMKKAKAMGKMIVAHCEVNSLLNGGYIHDGEYARINGHRGICKRSEWEQIKRDIRLAKETGCAYHVCHISTKESVELIRKAKADGVDITCETAPHYLTLTDMDIKDEGKFKMNPPIRAAEDRDALIEAIQDGTIDMIATDHAPHSKEEKSKGLAGSNMGVVGLETAFPILYTKLVKRGVITLERLIELMAIAPRKRFNIPVSGYTVWNLDEKYNIDPEDFLSMGKSTPFEGEEVFGKCIMTVYNDKVVFKS